MTSEQRARRPFSDAARATVGGAALAAGVGLAGAFLAQRSLGAEAVQAVMAEWGATNLGVAWSDPPTRSSARIARRAFGGVAIGLLASGLVLGFARATGAIASVTPLLSLVGLALALVHSWLVAMRDELLVHGIVLRLLRGRPIALGLLGCAGASVAWAFGNAEGADVPLALLVAEGLAGASFGALWLRERGAWGACGAHAAWVLATRGALLSHTTPGAWGGGNGGLLAGWAASIALVPVCAVLALRARAANRRQETSAPPPAVG